MLIKTNFGAKLHKLGVRLGLTYTTHKDAEILFAQFIINKFIDAAKEFEKHLIEPNHKTFLDCLKNVWKENKKSIDLIDKPTKFYIFDSFLNKQFPDITGQEYPIYITNESNKIEGSVSHDGGDYEFMVLDIGPIEFAKNSIELNNYLRDIIATIYHESDHIYNPGTNTSGNVEKKIKYYLNSAEIRARAKEIAYIYHKLFPGEKTFNYKKFKEKGLSIGKNSDSRVVYLRVRDLEFLRDPLNYVSLNDKVNWFIKNRIATRGHEINTKLIRDKYIEQIHYIAYFLEYFNNHTEVIHENFSNAEL